MPIAAAGVWHSRAVSFAVLFVCTGNICRSPMAERIFRARVDEAVPVVASSAGINALVGHPMDAPSAHVLRELGGDPRGHVGRRLEAGMVTAAELILTAERRHRSVIVQSDPLAFRRTFTLREFARLGAGLPPLAGSPTPDDLRERVGAVARQRGVAEPVDPGGDDIGDPFGAPITLARAVGAQVSTAIDATLAVLGLPGPSTLG